MSVICMKNFRPSWPAVLGHFRFRCSTFLSLCQHGTAAAAEKPNILVIWGDDIGQSNISAYTFGLVGYRTPNIDRIAKKA